MATVPGASVRERVGGRVSHTRVWQAAVVVGLLLCAAYAVLPSDLVTLRELVIYPVTELGAVLAIVLGVRWYRPPVPQAWLLIAGCLFLFMVGDVIWGVYAVTGRDPFPSPADGLYLAGYALLAAGLVVAIRRRTPSGDLRAALDAAIIAVSVALLAWVYIAKPALAADLSPFENVATIAYPLADTVVLALALRYVIGFRWNVPALRLLVLGLFVMLASDLAYASDVAGRIDDTRAVDTTLLVAVVLVGLAGLHPTMPALAEGPAEPPERDMIRLALLACVSLVPPVVVVVQALRGEPLHFAAVITAMVLLSALVVLGFADITGTARRAAEREALLSRYAGALLHAGDRDELFGLAGRAASALIGGRDAGVVDPRSASAQSSGFTAPVQVRGELVAELSADATAAQLRAVSDSLTTVASELSLALEREALLATERETADALAAQNEQLRELDRMKDQFVGTVSHELRTPLTSMIGYLELVLGGEAGELTQRQREFLEIVNRGSWRLNRLIGDILFISRVDAGRFSLDRSTLDLGQLAAEAVESAGPVAEPKNLELRLEVEDGRSSVCGDPTRLAQLLDNLLTNAIKFTPEGGTITIRLAPHGDIVRLQVSDTGVGIPPDELDRLFERFFRASTRGSAQGTGLGLSIVESIAEAHGGTISVESTIGVGTTFTVDLPSDPQPDAPVPAAREEIVA